MEIIILSDQALRSFRFSNRVIPIAAIEVVPSTTRQLRIIWKEDLKEKSVWLSGLDAPIIALDSASNLLS